jgi:hypothetical protein
LDLRNNLLGAEAEAALAGLAEAPLLRCLTLKVAGNPLVTSGGPALRVLNDIPTMPRLNLAATHPG